MSSYIGRQVAVLWNGSSVPGVREKGVNLNGDAIDVTSDEDSGWQTLLTVAGQNSVEVSLSGVSKDRTLRNDWHAGTRTRSLSLTYPDGSVLSGTFFLESFKEGNPYKDAGTFDASLKSSGSVTWTPGSG
ncbi:MAG: phage tail tube protein [Saprospiraceae bacterium]